MAETISPELYLSLLSGRYHGDVSHLSVGHRDNDVGSRLYDPQFRKDPDRLLNVLDALAAICVHKKGDVFFVSLAMNPNTTTLCVSTNGTVPPTLPIHLRLILRQLKALKAVLKPASSPQPDIESSDPSVTTSRSAAELEVQQSIYEYSYKKIQRRYEKLGPEILAQYNAITKSLHSNAEVAASDTTLKLLGLTQRLLQKIGTILEEEQPYKPHVALLIRIIAGLSESWKERLEDVEENGLLAQWDNLTIVKKNSHLSLRRFLLKMFTLHNHIRTILRIAWSNRLSHFLDREFDVIRVPAVCSHISFEFSLPKVIHLAAAVSTNNQMYDELLRRLEKRAKEEKIVITKTKIKKGGAPEILLPDVHVHAESTLLAYHLQNPEINPYHYFGGSKLSCHGCSVLFSSFNSVAISFDHYPFFTKGCHGKIYLRWPYPSLLSQEQQKRLRPGERSLDIEVKKVMMKFLSGEFAAYVDELHKEKQWSTPPQSDSTSASSDSRLTKVEDFSELEQLEQRADILLDHE